MKNARWMSSVGGAVDGLLLRAMQLRAERTPPRAVDDRRALVQELTAHYRRLGDAFFPAPPLPEVREERRGGLPDGGEIVDLAWPSLYEPTWPAIRAAYSGYQPNRRACARLFRHPRALGQPRRPLLMLLHGYGVGQFFVEERAFSVRSFYRLGLDVALFTLPFHALRGGRDAPIWPSANPARTNEGFGQAIFDLRSLMSWVDAPRRAVAGMSLGGYTTALLSTLERLDFACPMIPLASFPDLFWERGEGRPERVRLEREGISLADLRALMAVHTPLLRTPLVAPERMLVVSAAGDRITPPEHATRLAHHFGCVELRCDGGHVLQTWRWQAFAALAQRLTAAGLASP